MLVTKGLVEEQQRETLNRQSVEVRKAKLKALQLDDAGAEEVGDGSGDAMVVEARPQMQSLLGACMTAMKGELKIRTEALTTAEREEEAARRVSPSLTLAS